MQCFCMPADSKRMVSDAKPLKNTAGTYPSVVAHLHVAPLKVRMLLLRFVVLSKRRTASRWPAV
jgi:hypothetical protein